MHRAGTTRDAVRRSTSSLTLALAAALAATWLAACSPSQAQGGPPPAPPVSVAAAVRKDVQVFDEFSGRLEAPEIVDIRSRVAGTLVKIHFREGQDVARGALLFSIDARPFAAELERNEAQRAAARSALTLALSEQARSRKLLEQKAVSQQEVDQADAAARNAQANLRAAEAAVASARLNVEYSKIRAPIAGRASRTNITVGNLVGVGDPVLTTLVSQDKVYAWFEVSEQTFLRTRAAGSGSTQPVALGLADEAGFPHTGKIDFIDNRLNPASGSIRMRAVFDNRERQFVPGLAVRVRLVGSVRNGAVLTPERAIGTDQSKRFVLVVGADKVAQFREVRLGPLLDGMRIVESGLKPGEMVVVNGLQRVRPGAPVQPEVLAVDANGMPLPPKPPAAAASKS